MSRIHRLRSPAMVVTAGVYQIGPSGLLCPGDRDGGAR